MNRDRQPGGQSAQVCRAGRVWSYEAPTTLPGAAYPDWDAIYADNVGRIYRLMFAKVGNRPDAEDLTAEVFLAAPRPAASVRIARARCGATWPPRPDGVGRPLATHPRPSGHRIDLGPPTSRTTQAPPQPTRP